MPSVHTGMNVSRRVVGGNTTNQIDIRDGYTNGSPPVLQKAVVIDVIYDYNMLTDEYKQNLVDTVGNYELVEMIPINSIIAKIVSNEEGLSANPNTILFPFFSSHFMLPVKVGEIVHVIYQDYVGRGNKLGFWLSRIHGNKQVEDANYTHLDRQYDPINNLALWTTDNRSQVKSSPDPSFPNGGGTSDTRTLVQTSPNTNPYDDIIEQSFAGAIQTQEVVPRWNKRPQELVIQGSNNTLISLGEDRSGGVVIDTSNEELEDSKGFAGTIDMVVGRGRFPPEPNATPELTAARTIRNSRQQIETDKAPHRNKDPNGGRFKDNPREGDPDFTNDAARIYVTMQSVADNKFGITGETSIRFPGATLPVTQPTNGEGSGTINRSYVVGKADHIRLIARKNEEKNIEGTILFLREGDPSDQTDADRDLSYVFIDKNGINIESKKIFLGTAAHENPNENSSINYNDDNSPYEPFILWSKYRDTVNNLQEQINELRAKHEDAIKDLRDKTAAAFSSLSSTMAGGGQSIPYGPNSAVAAASAVATTESSNIGFSATSPLSAVTASLGTFQSENKTVNVDKANHSQIIYGSKGLV